MNSFDNKPLPSANQSPEFLPQETPRPPRKKKGRIFFSCFFILLIIVVLAITSLVSNANDSFFVGVKNGFLVRQITHFLTGSANELKGETDDRINFLLLGIGGPGHDGPYLTDTIILASFKPSTNEAALMSIPRDLIVPNGSGSYLKVNHVYALNQKAGLEAAFAKTKKIVGETFGLPIHYMGVIDFQGFVELIDSVGGITVTVDRSFSDYQFPTADSKIQTISFKEGKQKMDGLTALRFARSRHGNNGEGSDFARSRRQQKIIMATKEKVSSFATLFNPRKITTLFNLINQYTKADIEPWEAVKFIQMARDTKPADIYSVVLDDSPGGYLFSGISSVDSAYILQPRDGTYAELKRLALNMFSNGSLKKENARVVLQNGTRIANSATTVAQTLTKFGIPPVSVGNASENTHLLTVIYDYTNGKKNATRTFLESFFSATARTDVPVQLLGYNLARELNLKKDDGSYEELDFLIILGEDIRKSGTTDLIRTVKPGELSSSTPTSTGALEETQPQ